MTKPFSDIMTLLRQQAQARGDAIAVEALDGTALGYRELHEKAVAMAQGIAGAVPAGHGRRRPRIGLVLPNGSQIALALLAASIAGEATPFNPASKPAEFDVYFKACGIDALIVREDYDGPAIPIAQKSGLPILRLTVAGELAGIKPMPQQLVPPKPHDIALVLMTSGSTGKPKIVPLSHRNVCTSAADVCRSMKLGPDDRCLTMWEQHHIGGLVDLLMAPLASGGCVIATGGFNAPLFFQLLGERKPTWFQGVPTTLNELVIHARNNSISARPSSLRLVRSVAAALAPKLMGELEDLFGLPVIQTFGMTEAGPLISSTALPPAVRKPGSVGRSCGTEIRIVGPKGQSLPAGETGEVGIRGDNVFRGYENDAEANASQFRDGWFHTGDTGYLDADGDLFLTGRIKQLINRGGEKISPQEVDDVLLTHPAVSEAATFAVSHRTLGEDVAAAVVLRHPVSPDELRAHISARLAAFKVPHQIAILERLPRNPVGKIDRLALAEAAKTATAAGHSHTPPRNALEEFLVRLWQKELTISEVGIFDDFGVLGGDSLSSLRVLTAVEATLGIDIPDDIVDDFSPIARFSARLQKLGVDAAAPVRAGSSEAMTDAGIGAVLDATGVGSASIDHDPGEALRRMEASLTRRSFDIVADSVTLYCTPAELDRLLARMPAFKLGTQGSLMQRARMAATRWRWRNKGLRELAQHPRGREWRSSSIRPQAILYEAPTGETANKTLIAGFAGYYMRLMMPTYRILCHLDPEQADLLLLNDLKRADFMQGMAQVGDSIEAVEDFVAAFARERGYRRVVAIGTSGGGLPAIHAAISKGWKRALAVGAASPSHHVGIAAKLREIAAMHDPATTQLDIVYSAGNVRDADASAQIKGLFPNALVEAEPAFSSHNLLDKLYHAGRLDAFMAKLLRD